MERTSNIEHDRWMEKITQALRSFRVASQRKAEQMQAQGAGVQAENRESGSGERA